ncbi:flagellar basal body-associated FliL family protein [Sinisalibacter aestuarii]|uniref:Flagellar basal body-associated protein FliL n=1 Tax=Sinisalibacter aestuarii TaxID=2949426 RepID=A0ABQ5LNW1_9RHOB|nr:flagellar basal body-associated FliL family protein [Sinisalibacter aestuarii]GKY86685.1 flagellar basal body-associated protein FliL [Sinisalibacter aestuarii]
MGKILPVLLAIVGLGAGTGAGLALRPAPAPAVADGTCPCDCAAMAEALEAAGIDPEAEAGPADTDFVKLSNQFVIPVVTEERIAALVVLSISLEVPTGGSEPIYQREPKLRDAFLQVLFDHANSGGFNGAFTEGRKMDTLRTGLLETARAELGASVKSILITDIARQDM